MLRNKESIGRAVIKFDQGDGVLTTAQVRLRAKPPPANKPSIQSTAGPPPPTSPSANQSHPHTRMLSVQLAELCEECDLGLSPQQFLTLKRKLDRKRKDKFLYSKLLKLLTDEPMPTAH